jgi:hypothetical protein
MPDSIDPTSYNYTIFEGQGDFERFQMEPRVGSAAPDFPAVLLETGQVVRLSDYWRERDVLVEFGSFT